MEKSVVLIFPGGAEAGLEIHQALKHMKDVTLIAAGNSLVSHARFVCETYEIIPSIHEAGCLEALNHLIARYEIDYIFPAHDDIILFLTRNAGNINAKLLCPDVAICEMLLHKSKTYNYFKTLLPMPRIYHASDVPTEFPLFAKRERGEGGQGALQIKTIQAFKEYSANPDYIVSEYLPGTEFTVDCLSNADGKVLFVGPRERRRVRAGMSVNSVLAPGRQQECERYAHIIAAKLKLKGAWYFQMRENSKGELALMEISPRIAGTMALNRVRGVNFPLLTFYAYQGKKLSIMVNEHEVEIDRGYTNRYRHNIQFDTVFLDFDDVLYMQGQLVLDAIKFLFRCKNEKKTVFLLTRHNSLNAEPLKDILKVFGLADIFERIIHVGADEPKAQFIENYMKQNPRSRPVFIDDSFSQRHLVASNCHIPTFDLSMLELLTQGKN